MTKIYPEIEIQDHKIPKGKFLWTLYELRTILRKQHEGKWYLQLFISTYEWDGEQLEIKKIEALKEFYRVIYLHLICGKINPDLLVCETAAYPLDNNQQDETQRLYNSYIDTKYIK